MDLALLASSFMLGLMTFFSPCVLPLVPGFIAYLLSAKSGSVRSAVALGALFSLGVLTLVTGFGYVLTVAERAVIELLPYVKVVASAIIIAMGALVLISAKIPVASATPYFRVKIPSGAVGAYLYGLLYGPFALTCSVPVMLVVLTFALNVETLLEGLLMYVLFGVGLSIPFVVISVIAYEVRAKVVRTFMEKQVWIKVASGLLLVALGIYLLLSSL